MEAGFHRTIQPILRSQKTESGSSFLMNLAGIVIPGDRVPAVPGKQILYRNCILHSEQEPDTISSEKIPAVNLPPMLSSAPPPPAPRLF
jgi:ATP-dependent helicase Lhr and Lhr-like helicase